VQLPASSTQGQVSNSIPSHPVPFDCCSSRILFVLPHLVCFTASTHDIVLVSLLLCTLESKQTTLADR
jgi:hypothetical protein